MTDVQDTTDIASDTADTALQAQSSGFADSLGDSLVDPLSDAGSDAVQMRGEEQRKDV